MEIRIPPLSESVSTATLMAWRKQEGDFVERDEILIEVETDKVVFEIPAPAAGRLTRIVKPEGAAVISDDVIAELDTAAAQPAAKPVVNEASFTGVERPAAPAAAHTPQPAAAPAMSPAARKLAAEQGVKPETGSGRGGRVTKADVLAASETKTKSPATPPTVTATMPSPGDGRPEQRAPMSRLRLRIAERLLESQRSTASLTTFNEVNMQPIMEIRNRYKDRFEKEHGVKLGFMSFFVKAVVVALKKYPVLNASIDGSDIVYHGYYDIGIAVSSPRGLVVPIVRDADQLSIAEIEKTISELATRARDGKLTLEELTGGTFTITNGGVFGSMLSTPIINPPQGAILGMHKIQERPMAENGQVVIRPMMYLAISYDHRLIDGRDAVLGLVAIKDELEDPARLLLDV
ncbi:MAG TPA: 2-oxoglutarate dehydrogenase complex dihydrolipoyllysine-residue succinyltransferase [Acidiferrobacterales bacterium]|nr:2-oxoglutarate dehydrogenase complex dihydrolipoyllysine-residue succinyltransferase [Acidiferrobacterales bacterium]